MMGEVIGRAATICIEEDCSPREVYAEKLDLLKSFLDMRLSPKDLRIPPKD